MNYEILFQGDLQEDERIQRDFRVLLATRAGSQPVDRDLGIDWSCLDGPAGDCRGHVPDGGGDKNRKVSSGSGNRQN